MGLKDEIVILGEGELLPGGATTLMENIHKLIGLDVYYIKGTNNVYNKDFIKDLHSKYPNLKVALLLVYEDSRSEYLRTETDTLSKFLRDLDEVYGRHILRVKVDPDRYKASNVYNKKKYMVNYTIHLFDYVLSYNDNVGKLYGDKYIRIDFNLYEFKDSGYKPNYGIGNWGYLGRVQGFKGTSKFYDYLIKNNKDFGTFVHYGFTYNINSKGKPSGAPGEITLICKSLSDKTAKDNVILRPDYLSDSVIKGKFNAYPRYNKDHLEELLSNMSLAICPTMGIRKDNGRDKNSNEKCKDSWKMALEYTNFELADYKIPTMYSKYFIEVYEPSWLTEFPELIYEDFDDALVKSKELLGRPEELERLGILQNKLIKEKSNNLIADFRSLLLDLLEE